MDTVHPDDSARTLPPARDLLLHVQNKADESPVDKMLVDEPYEAAEPRDLAPPNVQAAADTITKPHLMSITNAQPCSPIPRTNLPNQQQQQQHQAQQPTAAADEYLRHRLSDMSVSASSPTQQCGSSVVTSSPMQDMPSRLLSPLEPNSQPYNYESYSRRGSITDPALHGNNSSSSGAAAPQLDFRRPSIAELNSLPLPTSSASASRRGSLATVVTDYDYSSRSPSPSPFAKRIATQEAAEYARRDSLPHPAISQLQEYDPYQRRHSIATAEATPSNRQTSAKYRAFRFPATATIPEAPPNHGPYSAPSSPPHSTSNAPAADAPHSSQPAESNPRYPRHAMRQHSASGNDHQYQYMQRHAAAAAASSAAMGHHPYAGAAGGGPLLPHRRRSILMDEGMESGPVIARRASMPVVGMRNSMSIYHPPPPHHHHHHHHHPHHHPHEAYNGYAAPIVEEEKPARKSDTPYSRSPELRVSHKLAERKRRKEMKELFDELRDSLPVEKNLKTSKWEILSKAVEYITMLKRRDFEMENEVNALRREVTMLKRERGANGSFGAPY